jgi:hypothetical protein
MLAQEKNYMCDIEPTQALRKNISDRYTKQHQQEIFQGLTRQA